MKRLVGQVGLFMLVTGVTVALLLVLNRGSSPSATPSRLSPSARAELRLLMFSTFSKAPAPSGARCYRASREGQRVFRCTLYRGRRTFGRGLVTPTLTAIHNQP